MQVGELPSAPSLNREYDNGEYVREGDEKLHVEFYLNPVDGLDHIKIMIPGDKNFMPDVLADERYQRRFQRQWKIYKGELSEFAGQTRLETVAWIDPGNVRELKYWHVHTVEQLAGVTDGAISSSGVMGLTQLREKAQSHLEEHAKTSAFDEVKNENAALKERLEKLEEAMIKHNPDMPEKRKAGRPRKDA